VDETAGACDGIVTDVDEIEGASDKSREGKLEGIGVKDTSGEGTCDTYRDGEEVETMGEDEGAKLGFHTGL